jgi:uncharacterized protein YjbI with pentapeptide repeats
MQARNIKFTLLFAGLIGLIAASVYLPAHAGCFDDRDPGMDWSGCKKTNKLLNKSNFTGSRFDDAILALSKLDDSNFTNASLVKTDMTRASAQRSRFIGADMNKSVGYRAVFDNAILKKVNLSKSEYFRASFRNAEIEDSDWSKSELGRVDFTAARLRNVEFRFTNLSRVVFNETILKNVNFEGAYTYLTHFENVDLRDVRNLSQLQLDLSCGSPDTILPDGLRMPDTWPCEE